MLKTGMPCPQYSLTVTPSFCTTTYPPRPDYSNHKPLSEHVVRQVEYFKSRKGPMAKNGITALTKSLAAIYYLPFQYVSICCPPEANNMQGVIV